MVIRRWAALYQETWLYKCSLFFCSTLYHVVTFQLRQPSDLKSEHGVMLLSCSFNSSGQHKYSATVLALYFGSKEMFSGLWTAKRNGRKTEEKKHCTLLILTDRINDCSVSPQWQLQIMFYQELSYCTLHYECVFLHSFIWVFVLFGIIIYLFFSSN